MRRQWAMQLVLVPPGRTTVCKGCGYVNIIDAGIQEPLCPQCSPFTHVEPSTTTGLDLGKRSNLIKAYTVHVTTAIMVASVEQMERQNLPEILHNALRQHLETSGGQPVLLIPDSHRIQNVSHRETP